jgi:hypothetical protein
MYITNKQLLRTVRARAGTRRELQHVLFFFFSKLIYKKYGRYAIEGVSGFGWSGGLWYLSLRLYHFPPTRDLVLRGKS